MSETSPDGSASLGTRVREAVSDALTYWEPRRIVYNAVLAFIVKVQAPVPVQAPLQPAKTDPVTALACSVTC